EWESRNQTQQDAVKNLRGESSTLTERVDGLAAQAQARALEIASSENRLEALRRSAAETSESLLRLHGGQKQAEEALGHQNEAMRRLEATEHEVLESSIKVRDSADAAAHDFESASNQFGVLKQTAAELQATLAELRTRREAAASEADALRNSLA